LEGSFEKEGNWTPWFPVIDYERCVNCKQCLNFCLFGVYGLSDEGKVEVVKAANCKTNCPACARVCPESAIIFPKYADSPINGDKVDEKQVAGKPDLSGLTRDEILNKIRDRGKGRKRFAPAGDATAGQKLEHLKSLQDQLGIPQSVLDSLSKGDKQHE
jgi:Pyruvate/2-oxoacid:ferredoxin oxidoreductase delta subunit